MTMHLTEADFLDREAQFLALQRSLGDAVHAIIKARWPHHTAKQIEREWGVDRATAKNVADKAVVSAPTFSKAVHSELERDNHWPFLLALGQLLTGESLDQYEERKLRQIIESADNAKQRTIARLERRAALVEGASFVDPDSLRTIPEQEGRAAR